MSPVIPAHLEKIKPYEPGKPIEELQRELGLKEVIKLASNESPLGPPEASIEAIHKAIGELNRYPDDSCYNLRNKISEKLGVPTKHITVGAGSAELIINAARSLLGPTDFAVISRQTFVMYWLAVQSVNGNMIRVPLKGYTYDLEAMTRAIDDRVRLVYIANPNNPTGTMITAEQFDRFMSSLPPDVVVVYDEAYREYVGRPDYPDPFTYYKRGDNIIILHTFSKVYGLAGLRVGYAIAKDELSDALKRVRAPFNISIIADAAAAAALDADEHVKKSVKLNIDGMAYLGVEMKKLGLNVIPSVTNFLLVDFGHDTTEVNDKLLHKGVIVRPLGSFEMPTALRITIGLPEENRKFIQALKEVLK
jgi:histidinol-phosphate aminotransferase